MSFYLGDEWWTMIQQGMIQARRWRATKSSPNSVLSVCVRVGRTKIANETVNETVCCSGHWRKTQQQGLGTLGDLGNGDRVQRLLSKQASGHRVCSLLDIHCRGTTREVTVRTKEDRPNAKSLHLTDNCFLRKSKNGLCAFSRLK